MSNKDAGIYSITSKINGKRYIGSSNKISTRWKNHKACLRANKHHSTYLQNHYNKYGEDDLIFSIVEIVERAELSLNDFKDLLIEKEQVYLNNWQECQFNSCKLAGSILGLKRKDSKYYTYNKITDTYSTYYFVKDKRQHFSSHFSKDEAIKEVEYIKTLNEEELINYLKKCKSKIKSRKRTAKNYTYSKKYNKYITFFFVRNKYERFSYHLTEQDALNEIAFIKSLNEEDLNKYFLQCKERPKAKRKLGKNYCYSKKDKIWKVQFRINNKLKYFGSFKTEQEAINKVIETRKELGISS